MTRAFVMETSDTGAFGVHQTDQVVDRSDLLDILQIEQHVKPAFGFYNDRDKIHGIAA